MSDPTTVPLATDQERQALEAMTREAIGRGAMRAQMILLSAREYSAPKIVEILIAEIQDALKATVYKWIERFFEQLSPEDALQKAAGLSAS